MDAGGHLVNMGTRDAEAAAMPTANGRAMVQLEGVRKSFGDNLVLDGIDLSVAHGEVLVIIGPSGSGKSTLLRCVNLLEPIQEGRIFLEGEEITGKGAPVAKVRQRVATSRALGARHAPEPRTELDVLRHRHVAEHGVVLEHEAGVTLLGRQRGDVATHEADAPAIRCREARHETQQRALAAAARPEQHEHLPRRDVERDAIQHDRHAEALGDFLDPDRHQRGRSARRERLSNRKKITNDSVASTAATAFAPARLPASNWAKM